MGIKAHGTNKKNCWKASIQNVSPTNGIPGMCFFLLSTGALVPTCSWRLRTAGTWGRGTTTSSKTSNRCFELRTFFRDQPPSQRSIKIQRLEGVKSFFCFIFLMIFLGYLLFWSKRGSFHRGKFFMAKEKPTQKKSPFSILFWFKTTSTWKSVSSQPYHCIICICFCVIIGGHGCTATLNLSDANHSTLHTFSNCYNHKH